MKQLLLLAAGLLFYNFSISQNTYFFTGIIRDSSNVGIYPGKVMVFKQPAGQAAYDTLMVTDLDTNGLYSFSGLSGGTYLVRAVPNSDSFPNLCPTYCGPSVYWNSAQYLYLDTNKTGIDITLQGWPAPTNGSGHITGKIVEGTFKRITGPGEPIKGVNISLINTATNDRVKLNITDSTGIFDFKKVPAGTYKFFADMPGVPMDTFNNLVTISSSDTLFNNLNVVIDSNIIRVSSMTSVKEQSNLFSEVHLYPNPCSNQFHISYKIEEQSTVFVKVLNLLGQVTAVTDKVSEISGYHIKNISFPENICPGLYFIRLHVNEETRQFKVIKK